MLNRAVRLGERRRRQGVEAQPHENSRDSPGPLPVLDYAGDGDPRTHERRPDGRGDAMAVHRGPGVIRRVAVDRGPRVTARDRLLDVAHRLVNELVERLSGVPGTEDTQAAQLLRMSIRRRPRTILFRGPKHRLRFRVSVRAVLIPLQNTRPHLEVVALDDGGPSPADHSNEPGVAAQGSTGIRSGRPRRGRRCRSADDHADGRPRLRVPSTAAGGLVAD